jgi:putative FmdB family regulatory protein
VPLYEYVCASCGERSEVLQRLGEEPLRVCPTCSGALRKLTSAPAFKFKGSGWYVNDYSGKKGDAPAAEGADPSSATVKPAAGAEAAAKPEPAATATSPAKPTDSKTAG